MSLSRRQLTSRPRVPSRARYLSLFLQANKIRGNHFFRFLSFDSRKKSPPPKTILYRRSHLLSTGPSGTKSVLVYLESFCPVIAHSAVHLNRLPDDRALFSISTTLVRTASYEVRLRPINPMILSKATILAPETVTRIAMFVLWTELRNDRIGWHKQLLHMSLISKCWVPILGLRLRRPIQPQKSLGFGFIRPPSKIPPIENCIQYRPSRTGHRLSFSFTNYSDLSSESQLTDVQRQQLFSTGLRLLNSLTFITMIYLDPLPIHMHEEYLGALSQLVNVNECAESGSDNACFSEHSLSTKAVVWLLSKWPKLEGLTLGSWSRR